MLFGRAVVSRLLFGSLLLLLMIGTRWAWIDCDGGTPSLTEYGYFQTDEGFYTGGGRQKFIRDRFISATRAAPCTYAICPSTHLLTWGAFEIFGQTTWSHRVFPFLINTAAWLCLFLFLSRKTLPWIAFTLCAVCLLNPLLMVYERTVCNDVLMASVLLIGYTAARKKGLLFPLLGGVVFGLGLWVKQSIWVLFPLGLSAAAMSPHPATRWRRMAAFGVGFLASACVQYGLIRLLIWEDAASQDTSIGELLAVSNSSYPLPNPFDWVLTFKGLSSFPRCPSDGLLSVWIALFLVLPGLLLIRRLTDTPRRWDGRLLLYLTLPLYAAAIIIMPVFYAHYYIPILVFVPVVWFEARRDLKLWKAGNPYVAAALMAGAIVYTLVSYHSFVVPPDAGQSISPYLANAYNLPPRVMWTRNGAYLLAAAGVFALLGLWARLRKPTLWVIAGLTVSALGVADLCFSTIPLCEAHKFTPIFSPTIRDVACLLQVSVIVIFFAVWGLPGLLRRGVRWHLLFASLFVCATLANPVWRNGARELTQRGHLHKQAVADIARLVPRNAVVFGERTPQLLLSLRPRVVPAPNADPVPFVMAVHKKYPERPLYAILDSEHNYHFSHYEAAKDKLRLEVVHTLKLPSFNNGQPSNVFLARINFITNPVRHGPFIPKNSTR
jgi:4-amino-4-deoxy-L-arabinose transferase-like glycosyltransferase